MKAILAFMKKKNSLRTDENLKKLYDNVRYHHNAIEIAGRKWSRSYRESSKVGPNEREYILFQAQIISLNQEFSIREKPGCNTSTIWQP